MNRFLNKLLGRDKKYCLVGELPKEQYLALIEKLPVKYRYKFDNPEGIGVFSQKFRRRFPLGKLLKKKNLTMIICTNSFAKYDELSDRFRTLGLDYIHHAMFTRTLPVFVELKHFNDKRRTWQDDNGNTVSAAGTLENADGVICFTGKGNKVLFGKRFTSHRRVMIKCLGVGNSITIGDNVSTGNTEAYTSHECALRIVTANNAALQIGNRVTIGGAMLRTTFGGKISIGDDCMFGWDINIWQSTGHLIFDNNTGEITNKKDDVILGRHCWLGKGCTLMGGAQLADNCVLGYGSITSSKFLEPNCVMAGVPAKVMRRDACWTRDFMSNTYKIIEDCKDQVGYNIVKELREK